MAPHATAAPSAPPAPRSALGAPRIGHLLRTAATRLFADRAAEYWLGAINPMWSLREVRARVIALADETPDTVTITLQPSDRFTGFRPGQFISVAVEVDGVRLRRCYSISSPPRADRSIDITVRRVEGGRVSTQLHQHLSVGDIVEISQAAGSFVLDDTRRSPLLMVAGGSGITAIMALIGDLERRGVLHDVVVLHYERAGRPAIFGRRLSLFAERYPELRVINLTTHDGRPDARLSADSLASLVPDFALRETFVCGPPPLVEAAERLWTEVGASERLNVERYSAAPRPLAPSGDVDAGRVFFERSAIAGSTAAGQTVLGIAVASGMNPATGCRMGICHTCTCTKLAGTVRDTRTGMLSGCGEETIQICVSVPVGDVRISL